MKKILVILMAMLLVVSLAACGNKAPDGYEDWTLSDWSNASTDDQNAVAGAVIKAVDSEADPEDVGATLGMYLGLGSTVGDFIEAAQEDPSIIQSVDDILSNLQENLSSLAE